MTDLIKRLRGVYMEDEVRAQVLEAADAIEALQAEIERLKVERDGFHEIATKSFNERDDMQLEIEQMEAQFSNLNDMHNALSESLQLRNQELAGEVGALQGDVARLRRALINVHNNGANWAGQQIIRDTFFAAPVAQPSDTLLKEMRYIAGISTGQVKRVADAALASLAQPANTGLNPIWVATHPDNLQQPAKPVAWMSESGEWVTTSKVVAQHHETKGQRMTPLYK